MKKKQIKEYIGRGLLSTKELYHMHLTGKISFVEYTVYSWMVVSGTKVSVS